MDRDEMLRALRAFQDLMAPRTYPRGVFRFRSIGEAQAARARVTSD